MTSTRRDILRFSLVAALATFASSSVATTVLMLGSRVGDRGFWSLALFLTLQLALPLAVFSAIGTLLGWYLGARLLSPKLGAVLVGSASALFVVVAAIIHTAALLPNTWVVLWVVPVPAIVGGVAGGISLWRHRTVVARA